MREHKKQKTCPACGGDGDRMVTEEIDGEQKQVQKTCGKCRGSGSVPTQESKKLFQES